MIFAGQTQAKSLAETGRARPLAITGGRRGRQMPEIASFAELGYPDVDVVTINGLLAPAATPPATVERLQGAVRRALAQPEMAQRLEELGFEVIASTPEAFAEWIATQLPKWATLVRTAGIRPE
jgi:tripartite-type tricarboxylate transporter receptor subunit TctC